MTHVLWSLQHQGFELWFKGGTSLSKGFGLIERFSEDLDLKLARGTVEGITDITQWKSTSDAATQRRREHFAKLTRKLAIPFTTVHLDEAVDPTFRNAAIQVRYPGRLLQSLGPEFRPFVLLEIGNARVVPWVPVALSSFAHDRIDVLGQTRAYAANRPAAVRCVHPLVTLLEKLDAIIRRFAKDAPPATFVRHYEDAARVILGSARWTGLDATVKARGLAEEMIAQRQLHALPRGSDPAFQPTRANRWRAIERANAAIAPMFWGRRVPLGRACAQIREWIAANLA